MKIINLFFIIGKFFRKKVTYKRALKRVKLYLNQIALERNEIKHSIPRKMRTLKNKFFR